MDTTVQSLGTPPRSAPSGLAKEGPGSSGGRSGTQRAKRILGFVVPFLIGTLATLGVSSLLTSGLNREKRERLADEATEIAVALQANLDLQFETLHALPPFFAASDNVTRGDFSRFVRPAMRRYPSIYVFQWLPRVTSASRPAFERSLRRIGIETGLREMVDAENTRAAGNRGEYFPVFYGEPAIQLVFGLDLATHPEQGPYYVRACAGDSTVATPPLSLIEDPPEVLSVIALSPVRQGGTASNEPCTGLAMMILRVSPIVTRAIGDERLQDVVVALTVPTASGEHRDIFRSGDPPSGTRWPRTAREISIPGQTWQLAVAPLPGGPLAPTGAPWYVMPVGLLLSALAGYGVAASVAITGLRRRVDAALELGQYKLGRKLGAGGMGAVYMARHRMLARPAAIKLIRPDALAGSGTHDGGESVGSLVARFEKEALATSQLESPHTISIYDFGKTDDGAFYYVMEYLHGVDLDTLVKRYGPIDPSRCIYLLRQACRSLMEAHQRDLVHRDIKPANIFVCRQALEYDFVKVLDFGLVKATKTTEATLAITQAGNIVGTPAFVAPETIMDQVADARSDIYALGCVAYWMLTGEYVFPADNVGQALVRHVKDAPDPPSARTGAPVPADLEAIVMRCLSKDPQDRPQSVVEVERALAACAGADGWGPDNAAEWWSERQFEFEAGADL